MSTPGAYGAGDELLEFTNVKVELIDVLDHFLEKMPRARVTKKGLTQSILETKQDASSFFRCLAYHEESLRQKLPKGIFVDHL